MYKRQHVVDRWVNECADWPGLMFLLYNPIPYFSTATSEAPPALVKQAPPHFHGGFAAGLSVAFIFIYQARVPYGLV